MTSAAQPAATADVARWVCHSRVRLDVRGPHRRRQAGDRLPRALASDDRTSHRERGKFTAGTEGTVFIHGIFFAHEPEQTSRTIGALSALYWPDSESNIRSARKWERTP